MIFTHAKSEEEKMKVCSIIMKRGCICGEDCWDTNKQICEAS